jgi:hypothetical protein
LALEIQPNELQVLSTGFWKGLAKADTNFWNTSPIFIHTNVEIPIPQIEQLEYYWNYAHFLRIRAGLASTPAPKRLEFWPQLPRLQYYKRSKYQTNQLSV